MKTYRKESCERNTYIPPIFNLINLSDEYLLLKNSVNAVVDDYDEGDDINGNDSNYYDDEILNKHRNN